MNERIRQLALQAGIHFHKGGTLDAGPNGIAKFVLYSDMEKFAELIVKECAGVGSNIVLTETEDNDMGVFLGIKQHFGVEE
jgi:hypothetical protein